MPGSRDSSILRSLAVAFGDGLAFGVGMKLTQSSGKPAVAPALAAEDNTRPLLNRLEQLERRILELDRKPAALAAPAPSAPFDQRVLEAVVSALDARLAEQSGQVERRLQDLEGKLTIELKTLHQQDHSVATGLQSHIEDLQSQFVGQLAAIRQSAEEGRTSIRNEITQMHREFAFETAKAVEAGLAGRGPVLESEIGSLRQALALEAARIAEDSTSQSTASVDSQIAELRQQVAEHIRAGEERAAHSVEEIGDRISELSESLLQRQTRAIDERLARSEDSAEQQIAALRAEFAEHVRLGEERSAQSVAAIGAQISSLGETLSERQTQAVDERLKEVGERLKQLEAAAERRVAELRSEFAGLAGNAGEAPALDQRLQQAEAEAERRVADLRAEFTDHIRSGEVRTAQSIAAIGAQISGLSETLSERQSLVIDERLTLAEAEAERRVAELRAQFADQFQAGEERTAQSIVAIGAQIVGLGETLSERQKRAVDELQKQTEAAAERRVAELRSEFAELVRTGDERATQSVAAIGAQVLGLGDTLSERQKLAAEGLLAQTEAAAERRVAALRAEFADQINAGESRTAQNIAAIGEQVSGLSDTLLHGQTAAIDQRLAQAEIAAELRIAELRAELADHARAGEERAGQSVDAIAAQISGLTETLVQRQALIADERMQRAEAAAEKQIAGLRAEFSEHLRFSEERAAHGVAAIRSQISELGESLMQRQSLAIDQRLGAGEAAAEMRMADLHTQFAEHVRSNEERSAHTVAAFGSHVADLREVLIEHHARTVEELLHRSTAGIDARLAEIRQQMVEHIRVGEERAAESATAVGAQVAGLCKDLMEENTRLLDDRLVKNDAAIEHRLASFQRQFTREILASEARGSEERTAEAASLQNKIAELRTDLSQESSRLIDDRVAQTVNAHLTPLRHEIESKEREILQLRQKLAESDRNAASMILAIGQACRDAAERIAAPEPPAATKDRGSNDPPPPAAPATPAPPSATTEAPSANGDLPGFAQPEEHGPLMSLPLISSIVLAVAATATFLRLL